MPAYLMSWNPKSPEATEESFRSTIINLLIDLSAKHVSSRVRNTVFFTTEIRIHALQQTLEGFKDEMHYHVAQVAIDDNKAGITRRNTDQELKESFDSDYSKRLRERGI